MELPLQLEFAFGRQLLILQDLKGETLLYSGFKRIKPIYLWSSKSEPVP